MLLSDRVLEVAAVVVLAGAVVLELCAVPGPWLTLGSMVGSAIGMTVSIRSARRVEAQRRAAFAERIRLIRGGAVRPADPPS